MPSNRKFSVRAATWHDDRAVLQALRREVFVVEQKVPEELEWDEADADCIHALAVDAAQRPIATGRLLVNGQIGRMAVVQPWRGQGVGGAILAFLVDCARRERCDRIFLNAQTHALGFYARHGFLAEGDEFMDAGIPHRRMMLSRRPLRG